MHWGTRIHRIRTTSLYSCYEVAKHLGVHTSTECDWEKMEYPPLNRIEQFCSIFDITLSEFFMEEKEFELCLSKIKSKVKHWRVWQHQRQAGCSLQDRKIIPLDNIDRDIFCDIERDIFYEIAIIDINTWIWQKIRQQNRGFQLF